MREFKTVEIPKHKIAIEEKFIHPSVATNKTFLNQSKLFPSSQLLTALFKNISRYHASILN